MSKLLQPHALAWPVAALLLAGCFAVAQQPTAGREAPPPYVTFKRAGYHGWRDAVILNNGEVEVIIVPSIGRVMQFRFAGEDDGPLWENRALDGKAVDPRATEWVNFGGDKPWPAPQSDWPKITPRAWPPPVGFDASAWESDLGQFFGYPMFVKRDLYPDVHTVTLTSPVDPHYGIRVTRYVQLERGAPVMRIKTIYEKVSGTPANVAVWVITQCKEPLGVFVPTPEKSIFPNGYHKQSEELPQEFKAENNLIFLKRDPRKATKIGTDAGTLVWVGEKHVLRVNSERVAGAAYPDNGSSAEVYTHPIPQHPYVELEMLGPLKLLRVGDKIERLSVYRLIRRTQPDITTEARAALAR
jgi:hypothetical protein